MIDRSCWFCCNSSAKYRAKLFARAKGLSFAYTTERLHGESGHPGLWFSGQHPCKKCPNTNTALVHLHTPHTQHAQHKPANAITNTHTHTHKTGDVTIIQIKYGLPYCVTCPSMSTDPGSLNPGTRRSRVPGWWDPGIHTNTGAGDTVLAKHT